ncbi:MAG: hypothetical protein WBC05_03540, partial [Sedimentisphaerales bacterium]
RVLDRMLLYERRIENSLHKTINRLKTQQMIRVIQQADARKQESAQASPSLRDEAATRYQSAGKKGDLKKQSQFTTVQDGTKSIEKEDYGNKPVCGIEENKANQSQFDVPELTKGAEKRKKSLEAVNSLTG